MNREQVIERLKQIKARLQSYPMDAIADIHFLLERLMGFYEFITNPEDCDSIFVEALKRGNKDLVEKNARLQAQLNKEIHYNRVMKSALEKYANFQASGFASVNEESLLEMIKFAQQVLKQVDNEE